MTDTPETYTDEEGRVHRGQHLRTPETCDECGGPRETPWCRHAVKGARHPVRGGAFCCPCASDFHREASGPKVVNMLQVDRQPGSALGPEVQGGVKTQQEVLAELVAENSKLRRIAGWPPEGSRCG